MTRVCLSGAARALTAVLALASLAPAAAAELKLGGYLKNYSMAFFLPEAKTGAAAPSPLGLAQFRLRLALSYAPSPKVSFQAAYDISPKVQDPLFFRASPFVLVPGSGNYRAADFRALLVPAPGESAGSFGLSHNLDRLSMTVRMGFGDLIVGRQPVAWGSGRVTNPTDILAPFSFHELDKEERFGVDAVRLRAPLGSLGELDTGYVFGRDFAFRQSAFFVRGKVNVLGTDLSLLLLGFQEDLLVGIDLARSLGGSGIWLEAAYVAPGVWKREAPKESGYARITAGIDRGLGERAYAFLEYHFNSAGSAEPAAYPALFSRPAYARGTAYLMGRHYLAAGLNYQVTPLIPASGLVIWNMSDGSAAFSPQAEYNISENIYLGAGAYLGLGRRPLSPLFGGAGVVPVLGSEFGSYPDFAFLSFRVYF
jgi:hypothetical protein